MPFVEKNAYYNSLFPSEKYKSEFDVYNHAHNELKFCYGSVTRKKFNSNYRAEDCFSRKIVALPAALVCGVVKTTFHFSQAVLFGIVKIPSDHGKYFLTKNFCIIRDLQQSFGWIVTIFNDRCGKWLVEGSSFQKTCYGINLSHETWFLEIMEKDKHRHWTKTEILSTIEYVDIKIEADELEEALTAALDLPTSHCNYVGGSLYHSFLTDYRSSLLVKIAQKHIENDDLEKALDVTKYWFNKEKEIREIIALKFIERGELEKATEVTSKLYNSERTTLMSKIVTAYLSRDEKVAALDVINKCPISAQKPLLVEVATAYALEDLERALEILGGIESFDKGLDTPEAVLLLRIATVYSTLDDTDKVLEILVQLGMKSFINHRLDRFNTFRSYDKEEVILSQDVFDVDNPQLRLLYLTDLVNFIVESFVNNPNIKVIFGESSIELSINERNFFFLGI